MPEIQRPLSRAIVGTFLAAAVLFTTACGASSPTSSSDDSQQSASYTVEHAMGEEKFSAVPTRIVVIDSPQLDALVSLGITPVGATVSGAKSGFPGYIDGPLKETAVVGSTSEPDIDAIANLNPDLIIGSKVRHEAIFSELEAIAPTVFSVNSGTDWTEQALITAASVNKTAEMEAQIADLDKRAVAIGETVGAQGKTASMVRFRPDNFRLYGPETFSGSLLAKTGFDLGQRTWNEYSMMELSPELFEQIDGEIIFYTNPGGDPAATTMGTVTGLWGDAPGVKTKNAFEVDDETWMVGIGVVGANIILDDIEKLLS